MSRFILAQRTKELAFRLVLNAGSLVTGLSSRRCHNCETRPAIVGIVRSSNEAVRFKTIDKLRDVRLHAREALGQLTKRHRLTSRRQQTGELGLDVCLSDLSRMKQGK